MRRFNLRERYSPFVKPITDSEPLDLAGMRAEAIGWGALGAALSTTGLITHLVSRQARYQRLAAAESPA